MRTLQLGVLPITISSSFLKYLLHTPQLKLGISLNSYNISPLDGPPNILSFNRTAAPCCSESALSPWSLSKLTTICASPTFTIMLSLSTNELSYFTKTPWPIPKSLIKYFIRSGSNLIWKCLPLYCSAVCRFLDGITKSFTNCFYTMPIICSNYLNRGTLRVRIIHTLFHTFLSPEVCDPVLSRPQCRVTRQPQSVNHNLHTFLQRRWTDYLSHFQSHLFVIITCSSNLGATAATFYSFILISSSDTPPENALRIYCFFFESVKMSTSSAASRMPPFWLFFGCLPPRNNMSSLMLADRLFISVRFSTLLSWLHKLLLQHRRYKRR